FFFQAEDGIRDFHVTGVQTCALPIWGSRFASRSPRNEAPTSALTPSRSSLRRRIASCRRVRGPDPADAAAATSNTFPSTHNAGSDRKSVVEGKSGGVGARGRRERRRA